MHLELTPSVIAKVVLGTRIGSSPRWMLDGKTVLVGPYHSLDEHERHLGETIGSTDWLWSVSDELRFDRTTHLLQSVSFSVPDNTLPSNLSLNMWRIAPQETGLLQLLDVKNFEVEITDFRCVDPQVQTLICVSKRAMEDSQQRLRLRIAENVELFFVDEIFCGWLLRNPTHFIVDAWEEPAPEGYDEQFAKILYDYLSLITNPYIEQMEDQNPQLLKELNQLYVRTVSSGNSSKRLRSLQATIADKLDLFYKQEVS